MLPVRVILDHRLQFGDDIVVKAEIEVDLGSQLLGIYSRFNESVGLGDQRLLVLEVTKRTPAPKCQRLSQETRSGFWI